MLRPIDAMLIPASVVWAWFVVSWEVGVESSGAPWLFVVWGIPFVVAAGYLTVGRFFRDAQLRGSKRRALGA